LFNIKTTLNFKIESRYNIFVLFCFFLIFKCKSSSWSLEQSYIEAALNLSLNSTYSVKNHSTFSLQCIFFWLHFNPMSFKYSGIWKPSPWITAKIVDHGVQFFSLKGFDDLGRELHFEPHFDWQTERLSDWRTERLTACDWLDKLKKRASLKHKNPSRHATIPSHPIIAPKRN